MKKIRQNTGIWKYLEECGVLVNGTEEQIKEARRKYRRKYILQYKRKQRNEQKEYTILLKKEELKKITEAAKHHHITIVQFLKTAAFAYLNKTYIVPNEAQVAHIEQTMIQILNEIQAIAKRNKILFGLNPLSIEKRINKMEEVISDALRNPCLSGRQATALNHPTLPVHQNNHDCENINEEKTDLQTTA